MPLLYCISYQIYKPSSLFHFFFTPDIPLMNAMLDLLRVPGKKGFSTKKLAVLFSQILFAVAVVWFAAPFIFGFLVSAVPRIWTHVRSSTAPPYLFVAVNFIILTIWKLSESRTLFTDRLAEVESESNPNISPFRPKDLVSTDAVHPLQKTTSENKTPLISAGNTRSLEYAGVKPSPAPESDLSCITTESVESSADSESSYGLSVPEPALRAMDLQRPEEKMLDNPHEDDSLDATWNAIMRKSRRRERSPSPAPVVVGRATGRVSTATPTGRNTLSEGNDEINQRFDDFIKKNYDQIRLRKLGE